VVLGSGRHQVSSRKRRSSKMFVFLSGGAHCDRWSNYAVTAVSGIVTGHFIAMSDSNETACWSNSASASVWGDDWYKVCGVVGGRS